jgi:hypothetical protein
LIPREFFREMAGASLKPALKKPPPKIGAKAKSTKGVAVRR